MRYAEGHKEEVRATIVAAAARALRKSGLHGIGIPALMKEVGLTHGGFYAHFDNRDELVAEAVLHAGEQTIGVFGDDRSLRDVVATYLQPAHRLHPEEGCVLAALGTEAPRQSSIVRRAFGEAARTLVRRMEAKLHPRTKKKDVHDDTLVALATLVGALVVSRMLDDEQGGRMLDAARKSIVDLAER
jgi:TetR/AcrR family transcriptional repressor of nem operon